MKKLSFLLISLLLISIGLFAEERSIFDLKKLLDDQGIPVKSLDLTWKNSTTVYDLKGYRINFADGTALEITRVSPAVIEDASLLYKRTLDNDILKIYGCPVFLHKKEFHERIGVKTDNDREFADAFVKRLKENFDDRQRTGLERNGGFYLKKKEIEKKEYLELGLESLKELEHSFKPPAAMKAKIMEYARKSLELSEYRSMCAKAAGYNSHIPSTAVMEKILKTFSMW